LWDRGAILALLRSELSRSKREHSSVSVLLCDIDHFKQVNDVHGHQVGDEVLEEVSTRLLDAVRPYDAVGRYGGEEFLIVLNGCSAEDLEVRAEQARKAICGRVFSTSDGSILVSMSIGAITIQDWDKTDAIQPFLKEADEALYRAKAAGRNRVICANTLVA